MGNGKTSTNLPLIMVGVIGSLAALSACGLLWSMARRAATPRVQPIQQKAETVLDALINDHLPLIEEPIHLPSRLKFYGRPSGPRKIRLDAGHPITGPHDRPAVPATSEAQSPLQRSSLRPNPEPCETRRSEARGESSSGRPPRPRAQPAGDRKYGLLNRVLLSVHGATQT